MKEIIVQTQEQYDALADFSEETIVKIDGTTDAPLVLAKQPKNSLIVLVNQTVIETIEASVIVGVMRDSSQVRVMWDSSRVGVMWDSSQVGVMRDSSQVRVMWNSSQVREMWDSSRVREMRDSSQVRVMWDSSRVGEMRENCQTTITSSRVTVKASHSTIIIVKDCKPKLDIASTVQVIKTSQFKHTVQSFTEIYGNGDEKLILYKSVSENNFDFYTGKLKYENTVECPDWNPDPEQQCGGGLHLSPTPELALYYNKGKLLKCLVHPDDIVVYGPDITKVRCRKVEVIGEVKEDPNGTKDS